MTDQRTDLCAPWSLHFDRDGTEDYGSICDAEGNRIVASHICGRDEWDKGTFWLPDAEGEAIPLLARQMQVMAAGPKLLDMLKIAVATADPKRHKWVKEAREAIAEATGQEYDQKEAEVARHMHKAAPRMLAALKACDAMLRDYADLIRVVDKLLKPQGELPKQIEDVRFEARAAWHEAQGEILF